MPTLPQGYQFGRSGELPMTDTRLLDAVDTLSKPTIDNVKQEDKR